MADVPPPVEMKDYHGQCHCGDYQYSVKLKRLTQLTVNASQNGYLFAFPAHSEDVSVEKGEGSLSVYMFGPQTTRHQFCSRCGVSPWLQRSGVPEGRAVGVNVRTLDGVDLDALEVKIIDNAAREPQYHPPAPIDAAAEAKEGAATYHGSCHCGAVRYTVLHRPLTESPVRSCNCSICAKVPYALNRTEDNGELWVYPARSAVTMQGTEALTGYQFGKEESSHKFCGTCGVAIANQILHQAVDIFPINARTLNGVDLTTLTVEKYDGKTESFMGSRKRSKPNPEEDATEGDASSQAPSVSSSADIRQTTNRTWYGGSWPRLPKSSASTQLDRKSILPSLSDSGSADSDTAASEPLPTTARPPRATGSRSLRHVRSVGAFNRSQPVAATTTKLNITSNGATLPMEESPTPPSTSTTTLDKKTDGDAPSVGAPSVRASELTTAVVPPPTSETPPDKEALGGSVTKPIAAPDQGTNPQPTKENAAPAATSWLDWLPKPALTSYDKPACPPLTDPTAAAPPSGEPEGTSGPRSQATELLSDTQATDQSYIDSQGRPWFGLWSSLPAPLGTSASSSRPAAAGDPAKAAPPGASAAPTTPVPPASAAPATGTMAPPSNLGAASTPAKPSAWVFWSVDKGPASDGSSPAPQRTGEVAIAGTTSQNRPEPATVSEGVATSSVEASALGKRGRPPSLDKVDDVPTPKTGSPPKGTPSHSPVRPAPKATTPAAATATTATKQAARKAGPPNLVLPQFNNTYGLIENPSIIQQLARLLQYATRPPAKHLSRVTDPPRIKRAVAIGVHGYFPAPLIRTVLGQPTGTSIRFANYAADAIRSWTQKRQYECEIEKVALEGEGKIAERVDALWKLLLNWIDHIQKADFILVACHSQGVPVAMMLVAKLIEFGCINAARVGVCAMAGVNLGPFPDYRSRLFSGSAGELFDFSEPESVVSKRYEDAMRIAVKQGVRILYIGSIDDQLVSLESSTFSTAHHPYIYRAVFIDGRVHAPDFITHLVGFALKLRNLGISDHGLIRELSAPLAGSLYTGEGHSRIYDDRLVYDLAVEHALETSSVGDIPLQIHKYEVPTNTNPFILPWAMRGVLEEEAVRTAMHEETTKLLEQFDNWKPTSKVLKDVKFRLEAVKSKL
ncbi:MAG: hypothetical protein M1838_001430 [Thelocarpon superellum]|nr:MAG: hypothetical protein M1838_001430 [Thelocarpon superellum]